MPNIHHMHNKPHHIRATGLSFHRLPLTIACSGESCLKFLLTMHIPSWEKEAHATEQTQQRIPENLTSPSLIILNQSDSLRIIVEVDGSISLQITQAKTFFFAKYISPESVCDWESKCKWMSECGTVSH